MNAKTFIAINSLLPKYKSRFKLKIYDILFLTEYYRKSGLAAFQAKDFWYECICRARIYEEMLKNLVEKGYLKRLGRGYYQLTDQGVNVGRSFLIEYNAIRIKKKKPRKRIIRCPIQE